MFWTVLLWTVLFWRLVFWFALVAGLLQRLRDALDAVEPGIPRSPDGFELCGCLGKLSPVDVVASLTSRGRRLHEPYSVEDSEVLGNSLTADRKLLTQRRRRTPVVSEKKVDDATARRISDGRPQCVVDIAY